jgi:hypothetical protein
MHSASWRPRSHRPWVIPCVLALHGLGLWIWKAVEPAPRADAPGTVERVAVRLLVPAAEAPPPAANRPSTAPGDRSDRPERARADEAPSAARAREAPAPSGTGVGAPTVAITPSLAVPSPTDPTPSMVPATPDESNRRETRSLDWTLPSDAASRSSRRPINPAVAQQIGRRATLSGGAAVEAAIANALPSGTWTEESVDSDTRIFRRGEQCFIARRPRTEVVNPINSAGTGGAPWVVAPC